MNYKPCAHKFGSCDSRWANDGCSRFGGPGQRQFQTNNGRTTQNSKSWELAAAAATPCTGSRIAVCTVNLSSNSAQDDFIVHTSSPALYQQPFTFCLQRSSLYDCLTISLLYWFGNRHSSGLSNLIRTFQNSEHHWRKQGYACPSTGLWIRIENIFCWEHELRQFSKFNQI